MARIKGVAIREFLTYLRGAIGPDALRAMVEGIAPEHRAAFDPDHPALGVLAASWYEAAPIHALLDAITASRSDAELEQLVHDGMQATMSATLRGVHRALLRVIGSPALHARFAQRLWIAYYDEGRVESEQTGPTRQVISYLDWEGHHPLLCRLTAAADLVIFPAMGLTGVEVKPLGCISRGSARCSHEVVWLP
ncbi:MAG: hypothetical protein H6719_23485 [Sandaracinaceae bacterium]|nr:hypothetical protein [Sandaracinaceae bacterium]